MNNKVFNQSSLRSIYLFMPSHRISSGEGFVGEMYATRVDGDSWCEEFLCIESSYYGTSSWCGHGSGYMVALGTDTPLFLIKDITFRHVHQKERILASWCSI